jgi:hypothetical protein
MASATLHYCNSTQVWEQWPCFFWWCFCLRMQFYLHISDVPVCTCMAKRICQQFGIGAGHQMSNFSHEQILDNPYFYWYSKSQNAHFHVHPHGKYASLSWLCMYYCTIIMKPVAAICMLILSDLARNTHCILFFRNYSLHSYAGIAIL